MLKITADEVNFLVYQYLEETGFKHTAFTFRHESTIDKSALNDSHIPPSMLLMYLEKALLMLQMETHLDKDDEVILCNQPFTLLSPHSCGYTRTNIDRSHDDPAKRPIPPQIPMHIAPESLPKMNQIPPPVPAQLQSSMPVSAPGMHPQGGVRAAEPIQDKMQIDTPKLREELSVQAIAPAKDPPSGGSAMEEEKHLRVAPSKQPLVSTPTLANARGIKVLEGHQGVVYYVAWHPTKRILASGGGDSTARLWQVYEHPEKREGPTPAASSFAETTTSAVKKATQLRTLPHINPECHNATLDVTALNWSNKKGLLVTGGYDGVVRVWDENGNVLSLYHLIR